MIEKKIQSIFKLGGFTVKKGTLWLLCNSFLLLGIIVGILISPIKQGMTIGCNNGSSGNYFAGKAEDPKENEHASE